MGTLILFLLAGAFALVIAYRLLVNMGAWRFVASTPRPSWRIVKFGAIAALLAVLGIAIFVTWSFWVWLASETAKIKFSDENWEKFWIVAMWAVGGIIATLLLVWLYRRIFLGKKSDGHGHDDHGGSSKDKHGGGSHDHGHGHGMGWQQAFVWIAAIVAIPVLVSSCQTTGVESKKLDIEARERNEKRMQEARVKSLRTCGRQGAPACVCQGESTETAIIPKGEMIAVVDRYRQVIDLMPDPSPKTIRAHNETRTDWRERSDPSFVYGGMAYIENRSGSELRFRCVYR